MRRASVLAALGLALLCGCREPLPRRTVPTGPWETGYWYWRQPGAAAAFAMEPERLYVQVGTLSAAGLRDSPWPASLPKARTLLVLWRQDEPEAPAPALIPSLVTAYRRLQAEGATHGLRVAGLQLDVDCPTSRLAEYAAFLTRLRAALGEGETLSVTALLDWFRPGTAVRELLGPVDEYVPQFYDARLGGPHPQIAEVVAAGRWAPIFNALDRPYRLGLSAFGRIQRVRGTTREAFRDVTLLDLAAAGLEPSVVTPLPSGERLLRYAVGPAIAPELRPGDQVEAIVPTADGVAAAYRAAQAFGGRCDGVVFFRWPTSTERLLLTPDEVAAALVERKQFLSPSLEAVDAGCRERACADLRVTLPTRFLESALSWRVEASGDLEYVLPSRKGLVLRQVGPRQLAAEIPPFLGENALTLGRVFSRRPVRFTLVEPAR